MSNFDFLKGFDDDLWKCGNRIEDLINIYPFGVTSETTAFLEHIVNNLRLSVGLKKSRKPFYNRLDEVYRLDSNKVDYKYKNLIYNAYQQRNKIHADLSDIEKDQYIIALDLHRKLYYIAKKYFEIFGGKTDEFKGFPPYKSPELDFSAEELELIEIPDFNDIIEFKYDYCVVCGEPNHSNYSIYCEHCNNLITNANNFISIRNSFGKDATFTKEDLIEFGIHEGYVNSLITSLNKSDLFRVKGRLISFNNSKLDSFITNIDKYIKIGELITEFREYKITPVEIKQTKEYKQGSFKQFPYYNFYKIINEEIVIKFEFELISTEDIQKSIHYSTISQKELNRWYNIQLNQYKKDNINEAFELFNNLLIDEYLFLKREGFNEEDIKANLNITKDMLEFFPRFRKDFDDKISEIKKDLILKALSENKTKTEVIEFAGITSKEYDDIIKYSEFKGNEFSQEYEMILNERKESLLINLTNNDLFTSCELSKITIDEFYNWYNEANINSTFYIESTKILMDKYLDERKTGKTKSVVCKSIGLKENIVDYWLKRKMKLFDKFKDENLKIIVYLVLKGFKNNKSKQTIANEVEVSVNKINSFLLLGQRGSPVYAELFNYYKSNIIPGQLSMFLNLINKKSLKKSLELSDLTIDELTICYTNNQEFHDKYLDVKINIYAEQVVDGRTHDASLKRSNLSQEEYNQLKEEIDEIILKKRMAIVKKEIENGNKTDVAAKSAKITIDDIYDWYYQGKTDDEFKDFSEFFYENYMEDNISKINKLLSRNNSLKEILRVMSNRFTQKDYEIWNNDGLINRENFIIKFEDESDKNDDIEKLKKEMGIDDN